MSDTYEAREARYLAERARAMDRGLIERAAGLLADLDAEASELRQVAVAADALADAEYRGATSRWQGVETPAYELDTVLSRLVQDVHSAFQTVSRLQGVVEAAQKGSNPQ